MAAWSALLKAVHKRQAEDVESVTDEDAWHKKWDPEVAAAIRPVLWAAAVSGAQQVTARTKADAWTPEKMRGYIKAMAASKAQRINAGSWQIIENLNTVDQDDEDEDEPHSKSSLFMDAVKGVAVAWAAAAVTDALGFGAHDAATGNGLTTKTWVVTSQNPRPEHAALDGETVGVDETFSNGGRWPGDGLNLDVDDVAGCTCVLQYAW